MDILSLIKKSRSYRSFDESCPVPPETLERLVECARFAPSGVNLQPLKFILSKTAETNSVIRPLTHWAGKLAGKISLPPPGHNPTAYIVICVDKSLLPGGTPDTDVGIAAQTLLLAATAMGFGGCMIGAFNREEAKRALCLPNELQPALIVALGKPDEDIILEDAQADVDYYRDENGVHHVPKRPLSELIYELPEK